MKIEGKCHCGNISYELTWPTEGAQIPVRACSCSFCTKHGGTYTSHPEAALRGTLHDQARVTRYSFGTRTAEFYICDGCGVVPFATSEIEGNLYAVVNVNCFEGIEPERLVRAVADFEGETTDSRLARRTRTWIPRVSISS